MTCGLLRYWGWDCYREYVPVDYEVVGGLSEATGRHYRLTRLYEPEELYGFTL
jgi:hypothetical protein